MFVGHIPYLIWINSGRPGGLCRLKEGCTATAATGGYNVAYRLV